jgi:hypothetical protein
LTFPPTRDRLRSFMSYIVTASAQLFRLRRRSHANDVKPEQRDVVHNPTAHKGVLRSCRDGGCFDRFAVVALRACAQLRVGDRSSGRNPRERACCTVYDVGSELTIAALACGTIRSK